MRVQIYTDGVGGRIELNGINVSQACRSAELRFEQGHRPRLELELAYIQPVDFSGEVRVILPDATRELLERLGWTPPENDDGAVNGS
ncbi:hypothetical protein BAY59_10910 [Prauserella coralliicola]|nr:hypothetical protein BAY59_10910 [Prauserella coralliicola]